MAINRRDRIMEHLARSTNGVRKPTLNGEGYMMTKVTGVESSNAGGRKQRIMEHVARSGMVSSSLTADQRKQRIMDHIRASLG